jgi:hypothetical protein
VLSGAAMAVASTQKELQDFLKNAGEVSHFCNSTSYTLYSRLLNNSGLNTIQVCLALYSFNCLHFVSNCYETQCCRLL